MDEIEQKPPQPRLTIREKVAYGLGQVNDLYMSNFVGQVIQPVYNIGLKLPLDLLGYALALPRLWDAVSDPVIGSWSDNFRSRWGRRKPFMVLGVLVAGLSLIALWSVPPTWGIWAMFWYLVVLSILYYTGTTLFLVPYSALGLAMSNDYNERTNLFAYKSLVDTVGGFLIPWSYFFVTRREWFDDSTRGAQVLSVIVALGFIVFCAIPVIFCRERYSERIATQAQVPLVKGVTESMTNLPFMLLATTVMLMFFGMFTIGGVGMYLNIFYVFGGNESEASKIVGWAGTMWKVSSLAFLPLTVYVSRRIGKKKTFSGALVIAATGAACNWWCMTPELPYLQLIPPFLQGPAISCILLMMNSMMADVCDVDELRTGKRREAMFTAINGWMLKFGITGATAISGVLLLATGFDLELAAHQAPVTITSMRMLCAGIPALGMLTGAALIAAYPLNEKSAAEVKVQLEARRGIEGA